MTASTRRGFSLIELLVVVSVVAVLASLLLPAVSAVRASAKGGKCASNLRQIGLLTQVFMEANEGHYPGGAQTSGGSVSWHSILTREVLMDEDVSINQFGGVRGMNCPVFRQAATSYYRCYSMNGFLVGSAYGVDVVPATAKHPSYIDYHLGLNNAQVNHPGTKVLLQETENSTGAVSDVWPALSWTLYGSEVGAGTVANGGQCAFRHTGAMATIYVDLHTDLRLPANELNSPARYNYKL